LAQHGIDFFPMLIDSHCHLDRLDLTPFDHSFKRFVQETVQGGVDHMLCVSITLERYLAMVDLVRPFPEISVSVGVHPTESNCQEPSVDDLIRLGKDPRVVAIGETGLDYFHDDLTPLDQQDRFRVHVEAARSLGKPLIIHTRDARDDTLSLLSDTHASEVGGVFHCFTEDWETAKQALDLNFYISLSGIVTFRNAAQIQEVARRVPDDRLLIETDSPYLAPVPMRGKPNYPGYVRHVCDFVASLRGVSSEALADQTAQNYHRLFGAKT
jgi:TatD DNase family protein